MARTRLSYYRRIEVDLELSDVITAIGVEVHKYRWAILGVVWLAYMCIYLVRLAAPPLSPFMMKDLQLSQMDVGLLISAAASGYSAVQIPAGWLLDKIGVKKMLFIGTFGGGVCITGIFFVQTFSAIIVILAISGFFCGFLPSATWKAIMAWFPRRERAMAMGLNQTSINIGGIFTATILPTVAIIIGWRIGYLAVGLVSMGVAVIAFMFYRDPPNAVETMKPLQSSTSQTRRRIREVIIDRNILLVAISGFGLMIVEFSLTTYLVIYLTKAVGISVVLAGFYLALTNGAGAFGKPLLGAASDRLFGGSRKKPLLLVIAVVLGITILMQFVTLSTPYWILVAILIVFGFTVIGWGGMINALIVEFAGNDRTGLAVGFSLMILLMGSILGPPAFGFIADSTGSYSMAWWFLTASSLLSIIAQIFVQEEKRKISD